MLGGNGSQSGASLGGGNTSSGNLQSTVAQLQRQVATLITNVTNATQNVTILQSNGQLTTAQVNWITSAISTVSTATTLLSSAMGNLIDNSTRDWIASARNRVSTASDLTSHQDDDMVFLDQMQVEILSADAPYNTATSFASYVGQMLVDFNSATHLVTAEVTYISQLIAEAKATQVGTGSITFDTGVDFTDTLKIVKQFYDTYSSWIDQVMAQSQLTTAPNYTDTNTGTKFALAVQNLLTFKNSYETWLSQAKGNVLNGGDIVETTDLAAYVQVADVSYDFIKDMVTTIKASTQPLAEPIQTGTGLGETLINIVVNTSPFVEGLVTRCFTTQDKRDYYEAFYDEVQVATNPPTIPLVTGTATAQLIAGLRTFKSTYETWLSGAVANVNLPQNLVEMADLAPYALTSTIASTYPNTSTDPTYTYTQAMVNSLDITTNSHFTNGVAAALTLKTLADFYDTYYLWLFDAKGKMSNQPNTNLLANVVLNTDIGNTFSTDLQAYFQSLMTANPLFANDWTTGEAFGEAMITMRAAVSQILLDIFNRAFATQQQRDFFAAFYAQIQVGTNPPTVPLQTGTEIAQLLLDLQTFLSSGTSTGSLFATQLKDQLTQDFTNGIISYNAGFDGGALAFWLGQTRVGMENTATAVNEKAFGSQTERDYFEAIYGAMESTLTGTDVAYKIMNAATGYAFDTVQKQTFFFDLYSLLLTNLSVNTPLGISNTIKHSYELYTLYNTFISALSTRASGLADNIATVAQINTLTGLFGGINARTLSTANYTLWEALGDLCRADPTELWDTAAHFKNTLTLMYAAATWTHFQYIDDFYQALKTQFVSGNDLAAQIQLNVTNIGSLQTANTTNQTNITNLQARTLTANAYAYIDALYAAASPTYPTASAFYSAALSGGGGGGINEVMYDFSVNAATNAVPVYQNITTVYTSGSPGISTNLSGGLVVFIPAVIGPKFKCTLQAIGASSGQLAARYSGTSQFINCQYWGNTYTPQRVSTTVLSDTSPMMEFVYNSAPGNALELHGNVSGGNHFMITLRKID